MRTVVIINPAAGGGRAGRVWPRLQRELRAGIGPFEYVFSTLEKGAARVAADAAQAGFDRVIAVGGDGTVNEVVNGLCQMKRDASPSLGILPLGTGNDFARGLGIISPTVAIAALGAAHTRQVDLGCLRFSDAFGQCQSRFFANVASIGLIGEVVAAAQGSALKRLLGSKLAYPLHAVQVLRRYRGHDVEMELEDGSVRRAHVLAAAVANGRYFGAGMKVAPEAALDDGFLDVLVAAATPKFRAADLRLLYSGRHVEHPAISHFKARRVRFAAVDGSRMLCETDGELQGHGPCDVEVMPGLLRVFANRA